MATPPPPPPSTSIDNNNNNRSDSSRMYNNIDRARLARLRPEKNDDVSIKNQIVLIQQACNDVDIDADSIAVIFHECDYNLQNTIARIKSGDIEQDGGWQTAKPTNKKRNNNNNNANEPMLNGGTQSDSERSHSQRTSPTPSLRGGAGGSRRYEHTQHHGSVGTSSQQHYHHPPRGGRRGNDTSRGHFIPSNARFSRHYSNNKIVPSPTTMTTTNFSQPLPTEIPPIKKPTDEIVQATSPSPDEYVFIGGTTHSLTFDNSLKKTTPLSGSHSHSKRPMPSSIPLEPVSMHPSIQHSNKPLDIQFGDVQWNNSVPTAISPSINDMSGHDEHDQNLPETSPINVGHDPHSDSKDDLSSNFCNHQTTNESDMQLLETSHPLSSSSLSSSLPTTSNNLANNLAAVSLDGTSHLSDHLAEQSSPGVGQFSQQQQQQPPQMTSSSSSSIQNVSRLPPTSTPRSSDYTSPLSHVSNPSGGLQPSLSNSSNGGGPSAFTPLTTHATYPSIPRDYSHAPAQHWNQHSQPSSAYKNLYKSHAAQGANYQQQTTSIQQPATYQAAQQQPIYFLPQMIQMIPPLDSWSTATYPSSLEPYPTYPQTNYLHAYPNQQYHPANVSLAKHDQQMYDKEFFAHYGQTRSSNTDPLSYQQQQAPPPASSSSSSSSSQQVQQGKDAHVVTSNLSATAASFSQGAPLTAAAPSPAFYWNPIAYPVSAYFPSAATLTPQDRMVSYAPIDTRDNRNGASYGGNNNRNHYHHHGQQQRSHNNTSNSTWHSQQ